MKACRRAFVAPILSLATVAALGLAVPPPAARASAPDDTTAAITGLFDRLAAEFLPQVASSTALSQQLPTLAVTPAGSVGLATAFGDALAPGGQLADADTKTNLNELTSYIDGADGDGWTFTATKPTAQSITVGFQRTVATDAGLDIRSDDGTLSLSTGSGIDVTGTLSGSFTFGYDASRGLASLTSPSLSIATTADLPDGKQLNAGLGILGVKVVGTAGDTDYHLTSNVVTTWANPDNDAAGTLAFDNPDTPAVDDGELAADGAGTGIVTAARTGSLAGHLVAEPRANDRVANLPSVGGTVDLSSTSPATFETPSVSAVVPDAAKPFLTLTPRDLAAGLSQAASAIIGMQDAGDGNLPLMRGSIGNAIDAVGGIKAFLADQVPDADTNDHTPGQPKFASLQDMLAALDTAAYASSGWSIDVLGGADAATFDAATKVVGFTIRTTRSGKSDLELNILGAPTTGIGTYSATGLTATGVDLDGPQGTGGAELVGRRVSAGTSYGTIASIDSEHALTLTADGWSNGEPTDGTVFSIQAADPKTGAPELAGTLEATTGIATANADTSTATVTPDVTVTLPMALDLRAPLTYVNGDGDTVPDCDPGAGTAPCPFQQVDDSGLARVISSLPLAGDRIMLRRSARDVLVADADITSPVQIQTSSGFLALSIGGKVEMTVPDGQHLQTLALTGSGDIPIPAFVEQVRQQAVRTSASPDDVFTQTLGGSVKATLDISVDDAPDAFADGENSTSVALAASVAALADGIGAGEVTVTPADATRAALLKALNFEPDNPTSLFGGVQSALQKVGSELTSLVGGGLDTPIPFVGSSVGQLIGAGTSGAGGVTYEQHDSSGDVPATTWLTDAETEFDDAYVGRQVVVGSTLATVIGRTTHTLVLAPRFTTEPADGTPYLVENELLGAVHRLQQLTPDSLQDTIAMAEDALGSDSTIDFGLVDANGGSAGGEQLRLDLTWHRAYGVARPVNLQFGDQQLVGGTAGGELSVEASGTVTLRLLVPLTTEAMLDPVNKTLIDRSATAIDLDVEVTADPARLGADIGPISVALGTEPDPGSFHAGFGVEIKGATATGTAKIADFFSGGFDVGVTDGDACAADAVIVCADFPVYVNGAKVPANNLTVTSTMGAGDDLADVFGDTSTAVVLPSGLQSILEGTPFKFDTLAEGLQQYLFYAETALRTASNDGEMPIVGKDLQAGADFMGATRAKIDQFITENGDPTTVGGARTLLTTTLANKLGVVVNGATGIQVDFSCRRTLDPPSPAPTAAATGAADGDTTTYVYKVVTTFKDAANNEHDSVPSEASAAVTNAATLSATKYNTVTWTAVDTATSYKILRATQTDSGTSAYTWVGTVTKPTVTFEDKGTMSTAYTAQTAAYRLDAGPCADDDSLTEIDGVTLGLVLGQGDVSAANGCQDSGSRGNCAGGKLPIDLGLPGLSLKTGEGGSVSGKVGWALDVKIGLSRSKGFYIDTADANEFEVGAALQLDQAANANDPDLKAQLSIVNVDVTKKSNTPEFVGHFGIDIKDGDDALTLAEIGRARIADTIVVSLAAKVDIDWHLAASVDAALPGVSADFKLTWAWGAGSGNTPADTSGLKIAFNHVTLDAGAFFGKALKPYLQQLIDATKPLQPIIDTIFTPMPVISDLSKAAGGDEVTIASLAETFNTLAGGPKIKPFLDAIKTVKELLAGVKCDGNTCGVDIGSFNLLADRAATTNSTAGNAKTLIDKQGPSYQPNAGATQQINAKDASNQLASKVQPKASLTSGIAIPVIEDPTILFELITGGDIALVEFDSGPLSLGFQFQKSFGPIYAPPPVMMVIGGGASVELRIAAGFDTYGIRRAIETGEAAQVLDSLYFKTVDKNGVPIPVVRFTGYLEAGASVSIGVLEVGVVGGIKLTVGFYWNDPNNDGKFRLFEFAAAVANNPICLFNVGGELSLYIKVFVEIGVSPFSVSFDFTLINIKLLDFNLKPNCTPPPPRLGGTEGGVLYVFAGKLGGGGPRGDPFWAANNKDETWVVRQVPAYSQDGADHAAAVEVRGLGITESFPDTAEKPIHTVVLDGRGYAGKLTVTFTGGSAPVAGAKPVAFTKKAVVFTGSGDDIIRTGEGDSWVDSGGGVDSVVTMDRTDLSKPADSVQAHVAGGPKGDNITVGNGKDTVTGDGSLVASSKARKVDLAPEKPGQTDLPDPIDVATLADPADAQLFDPGLSDPGADQIAAGLGQVRLSGNGGIDTIGTANDSILADSQGIKGTTKEALYRAHSSVLVGGAGGDVMKSGSADDEVYTGSYAKIDETGEGAGDAAGDVNTVDSGIGSDKVYGSNGRDFVTTGSLPAQKAVVYGGGASDVLSGGRGSDEIYGGPGDDYVIAAPATVGAPGSITDELGSARDVDVLPGAGGSPKLLVGGTGSDRIYGSDGTSTIFGDTTVDKCVEQSDPVSKEPGQTTVPADAADLIIGGNGVDTVNAGGGDDWVHAGGAGDLVCGNAGNDHLYLGDGDDLAYGGSGSDQGYGEAGADRVYGNTGADWLYGGADADRIQGNDGVDWLDGGTEADVLLGGTSKAGLADVADTVLGGGGADRLIGDNAQTDQPAGAAYPTDLGSADSSLGGGDYLAGGDDGDLVYGGLGNDRGYGGAGDDVIEGNAGTDRIWGETGDDDVTGGSSELASGLFAGSEPGRPDSDDFLYGGNGQDVIAGDNARIVRTGDAHPVMAGRGLAVSRGVDLADEGAGSPSATLFGGDTIEGGDEADVVFGQRGGDAILLDAGADYGEGGPGTDSVGGGSGDDDIVGGSFTPASGVAPNLTGQPDAGDTLAGDAGQDVLLGDNGSLTRPLVALPSELVPLTFDRVAVQRLVAPYDLGDAPVGGTSGADTMTGGEDADLLLGQGGDDRADGGADADYAEGGQGSDLVLGGGEDDDLAGGSSASTTTNAAGGIGQPDGADDVYGGSGSDLVIGDNGMLTRAAAERDWRTERSDALQSALVPGRRIVLHDLNGVVPAAANGTHSGGDAISGQDGVDVVLGQDGNDAISGGGDDDYIEGNGGADSIHGDVALSGTEIVAAPAGAAWTTPDVDGAAVTAGQDDITGGWSRQAYRDGDDVIHGDGDDDFVVADNGSIARVVEDDHTEQVYSERYGALRTGHAKVRVAGGGASSTRFCPTTGTSTTSTCEVSGAWGADTVDGDDGQDVLYGQDGPDRIQGGGGDDDIYGELGEDVLSGNDGEDAILGDRGGVQNRYEDGSDSVSTTLNQPPAVTYRSRLDGSVSREADLHHDVDGTDLVGSATSTKMPLDGIAYGGADRIRGGNGHDSIHAGAGADLANGDAGGDVVFGDRGNDLIWGGVGRACVPTDIACLADPGTDGSLIDHLAGGKDADIIDWRPRGVYGVGPAHTGRTCTTGTVPVTTKKGGPTTDPCSWFEMTDRANDVDGTPSSFDDNQHHQGVDWIYGGWDRDVMQGDVADNGPNPGDRLIDWSGVYNLYSHCNAAYGGFNDIRIQAPSVEDFLQDWAFGIGAGRSATDVLTPGTSAHDELALVTNADAKAHGNGSAYPTTPGHFDDPNACDGF
ncbi:calcium-binding protein [Nocardioides albidus]|uniref:Calcium-binding protein n=1 Tax=Nocardioides albidus TaxID=1517589 RepID=A0A5C4VWW2_9ACTN|nr:calcium-binding protein [Nocardioides albidus]TNM39689.1 calcium-binding protein [Nocardioides albidus]